MSVSRGHMSRKRYRSYSQAFQNNNIASNINDARSASLPLVDGIDAPLSVENAFCSQNERWTPFLVFTTLKTLPCSGILQAKQITARTTEYSLIQADDAIVPVDSQLVEQIFNDKELIRPRQGHQSNSILDENSLLGCIRRCLFADPYFKVVCEIMCKPTKATFALKDTSDEQVLQALEQFVNNASEKNLFAQKKQLSPRSFADQERDYCSPDAVCMRVSIMLNDSALGEYFAAGFGATLQSMQRIGCDDENVNDLIHVVDEPAIAQTVVPLLDMNHRNLVSRQIMSTCSALEILRADLPLRCSPTPVGVKNRIPRLLQCHGLELDLFDYQRRSVFWMMAVEQRVLRKSSAVRILNPAAVSFNTLPLTYIKSTREFRSGGLVFSDTAPQKTETLDVHGGILAAKTGSGKTTTAIALIYLQKVIEEKVAQRKPVERGDVENLDDSRKVPIWYPLMPETSNLYYVNCTLVVAPKQMVHQWADEFKKTISPVVMNNNKLRVHIIANVNDLRKLTVDEITRHIDVLIVNKQIFASTTYREVIIKPNGPGLKTSMSDYHAICLDKSKASKAATEDSKKAAKCAWRISYTNGVEKSLLRYILYHNRNATAQDSKNWPAGSFFECLFLHSLHFRRIIIDEVHELDSSWSVIERAVASLSADVKWGLTATPGFDANNAFSFANDSNQRGGIVQTGYPALLSVARGAPSLSNYQTMWPRYYFAALMSVTSADVGQLPPLHLHRVPVSLTPIETAIYCSISENQKRRQLMFCSHHVLDDEEWQRLLHEANQEDNDSDLPIVSAGTSAAQVAAAMQRSRVLKLQQQEQNLSRLAAQFDPIYNEKIGTLCSSLPIINEICQLEPTRLGQLDAILRAIEKGTIYVERDNADDEGDQSDNDQAGESVDIEPSMRARRIDLNNRLKKGDLNDALRDFAATQKQYVTLGKCKTAILQSLRNARDTFINMERNVREAQRACETTRREYNFFDAVLRRVTHPDESLTCPICLDDGESMEKTLILSSCGHELCEPCAKAHFARSKECPQCRCKLKVPEDLRRIDRQAVDQKKSEEKVQAKKPAQKANANNQSNADTYGSKLARMLGLIDQILARPDGNKIIIHSQFERLLRLTSNALKEFGIGHVYVGGSIQQCQNALNRFKNDPACTIVLLSSESTISGVSLVEANHMIVLHPPLGNNEQESFATFWQAAGRMRRLTQTKECHMWSLVTSNTIEVTLYDSLICHSRQLLAQDSAIHWDADAVRPSAQQDIQASSLFANSNAQDVLHRPNQQIHIIDSNDSNSNSSSSSSSSSSHALSLDIDSDSDSSGSGMFEGARNSKRKRTMPDDSD